MRMQESKELQNKVKNLEKSLAQVVKDFERERERLLAQVSFERERLLAQVRASRVHSAFGIPVEFCTNTTDPRQSMCPHPDQTSPYARSSGNASWPRSANEKMLTDAFLVD